MGNVASPVGQIESWTLHTYVRRGMYTPGTHFTSYILHRRRYLSSRGGTTAELTLAS